MTGTDGVLAALGLSAMVAAGSAYVALDYVMSPFATVAASAPNVQTLGPFLAENTRLGAAAPRATFADPDVPRLGPSVVAAAPDISFAPVRPVRLVYGAPDVIPPQRPGLWGAALAPSPTPRPGIQVAAPTQRPDIPDNTALEQLASLETETGPATAASTFRAPGLNTSLVPEARPRDFARIVAAAAPPAEVAVTRAVAPEVEIAAPTVELTSIGPIRGAGNPCTGRMARAIPNRSRSAPGGSELMASLDGVGGTTRDNRILQAAIDGNVPDFLRNLRPVSFSGRGASGEEMVITICVTPDYLAVGSDRDFVRVPLGLTAALRAADRFDMMLPTPRMVDAIYAQADLRLSPQPMTPGAQMVSTNYFMRHDRLVDEQLARIGGQLGLLVAGQKKDVVLANRLSSNPGRIAIYGWHRSSGSPIQPLSTVHGAEYADYSHGIRLVSQTAFVNGRATDLGALLTDARYASVLNSDGPITGRAVQLASLR